MLKEKEIKKLSPHLDFNPLASKSSDSVLKNSPFAIKNNLDQLEAKLKIFKFVVKEIEDLT